MMKLRVGVFMGGKSIEKEVSFNSGRTICDQLDTNRYTIIPIFQHADGALYILPLHFLHRGKISDFSHRLAQEAKKIIWDDLKQLVDFIYIAQHGRYGEDGTLQGFFQVLNIPYLGSDVFGSALSMNKLMQKKFLQAAGICVPKGIALTPEQINNASVDDIAQLMNKEKVAFPCVVKPNHEGSSFGVKVVHHKEELLAAVHAACLVNPPHIQEVLIEEKIQGMEFSCIIITDYKTNCLIALMPTEVVADTNDQLFNYDQKYMPGHALEFTPPRCKPEHIEKIQHESIKVMQTLGMSNLSRIDGFLTDDGTIIIIDPNALSGMAPTSFLFREAAQLNMSHTQLINHLIETELHVYGMLEKVLMQEQENKIMDTKKLRVAVLLGGASNEREISLESGRNVVYKLSPAKYQAIAIYVSSAMELYIIDQKLLISNTTHEIELQITQAMKIAWADLPTIADFVFIALHGGVGEDGSVQGTLQMLGLPYNGSGILASSLCMNKQKTNEFLKSQGFQIPAHFLINQKEWFTNHDELITSITKQLPFPLIVKPHDDGCSVMVQKVSSKKELINAVQTLFNNAKEYAFIEECIQGMELTVGVFGNEQPRALPPSQAISGAGILSLKEKFLPGAGENQTPAPLSAHALTMVQQTMQEAYKTIGCKGYARIDCFYQNEKESSTGSQRVVFLEFNTLPALTPATCIFHQAAEIGMRPMEFIDLIITLGIQEHKNQQIPQELPSTSISL
jgi:D-alanine--D-alanine ligase